MSGGVGSRLWPYSRSQKPKQFLSLFGQRTLIGATLERLKAGNPGDIFVVGSQSNLSLSSCAMREAGLHPAGQILEPSGRNTAAAVAVATLHVLDTSADGLVLVSPSDAYMPDDNAFWDAIRSGLTAAEAGAIVAFGMAPTRPETGYGYIECDPQSTAPVRAVRAFTEKPDRVTAARYLALGNHFWNAGIFLFKASVMEQHFQRLRPDIWSAATVAWSNRRTGEHGTVFRPADYQSIPDTSVDFAIMEKASPMMVVPCKFSWSDVGSWQGLKEISPPDSTGNVARGDVELANCEDVLAFSDGPLITASDLKSISIIATRDAVFVAPLDKTGAAGEMFEKVSGRYAFAVDHPPSAGRLPQLSAVSFIEWLKNICLPFWIAKGPDHHRGGFHESLWPNGEPSEDVRRTRTMARQTFSYALAHRLGWCDGADIARHGLDYLKSTCNRGAGGFVRSVSSEGKIADPTEDLYDLAFVLLAGAASVPLFGEDARSFCDEIVERIETRFLRHNTWFCNELGTGCERLLANSHMHLLEALLELRLVTKSSRADRLVDVIIRLFHERLLSPTADQVFEELDVETLAPLHTMSEPGHAFGWITLLSQAGESVERGSSLERLYLSTSMFGINPRSGLVRAGLSQDRLMVNETTRSWMQAERVRASLLFSHLPSHSARTERELGLLFDHHLQRAPRGAWLDSLDDEGQPSSLTLPASILYHMVTLGRSLVES